MSANHSLPSFLAIREAIMTAPPRPDGFPLTALLDTDNLSALREAPYYQQFLAELHTEAAQARSTPIPPMPFSLFHLFEATGDRGQYERPYFDRRRRLLALALETAVAETDANLPALQDLIWELCNEYTWALPAHLPVGITAVQAYRLPPEQIIDLFAAHTAHALAETLALLGEQIAPWLHYRVRTEIERRIFVPLFHDPHHFKWEYEPINWAAVCAGCAGMAALILEDDRERLAGMIDRVVRALECFLEGFGADGGCMEGIDYWAYGFGYYTYFAEMFYTFTNGRLDLFQGESVQRIAAFPQAIHLGNNTFVNYSDAAEHVAIHAGLGSYLSARFQQPIPALNRPSFHTDHIYRWGNVTRDLLWTDEACLQMPAASGSFYLSDIAWVIEHRLIDGKIVTFSAKGGHNEEPHNHNDLGHFILHLGGESLLADLGAGVYTRQYFGAERYEALHAGSQGHSVPVINGTLQGNGRSYAATVHNYEAQPDGVVFALDLTRAYPETAALDSFIRSFTWLVDMAARSASLQLVDVFRFQKETAVVEECFISLKPPIIAEETITWNSRRGIITMCYNTAQFEPFVDEIATQTHLGNPINVFRLRLRTLQSGTNQKAAFLFTCRLLSKQE